MCAETLKKPIIVFVLVAFLMVCVFAPYGTAHAIVGISTAAVTILIAGLAAIGITFASTGGFDTVNEYVESLLQEYASDNNIPVTSIFNGTQYSSSAAGKLLLNNRFVTLIDTFAQWIIGKYSLTDNNNITVQATGGELNGYALYETPLRYKYLHRNNYGDYYRVITASPTPVYAIFCLYQSYICPYFFSEDAFAINVQVFVEDEPAQIQTFNSQFQALNGEYKYVYLLDGGYPTQFQSDNGYTYYQSKSAIDTLLAGDSVVDYNNIGIGIDVGSIDLPSENTGYTTGDGAILDVGASWGESTGGAIATVPEIWPEWLPQTETITAETDITIEYEAEAVLEDALPQPSDIENLPGSTIPSLDELPTFQFQSLWHYVAQWISDMTAGGTVLWNVCVQAPPAVVNLVFAGIVLAMWFGAIKILR